MGVIVSNVHKAVDAGQPVQGLTFTVADGEVYALLGPAEAGKSTAIACLAALTVPDAGSVKIEGLTVGADDEDIQQTMGAVFQQVSLNLRLTVRENIALHGAFHGLAGADWRDWVEELVQSLELANVLDRRVERLSAGEQRRVDFVRALIHRPTVLIVDEPTADIDPHSAALVWQAIRNQRRLGTTMVLATDRVSQAQQADRIGVIVGGRLVAEGTPSTLVRDHAPSVLTMYLADPVRARQVLDECGIEVPEADGHWVNWDVGAGLARDIIGLLGQQVQDFEFRHGSLADTFQALVEAGSAPETWEETYGPQTDGVIAPLWPDTEVAEAELGEESAGVPGAPVDWDATYGELTVTGDWPTEVVGNELADSGYAEGLDDAEYAAEYADAGYAAGAEGVLPSQSGILAGFPELGADVAAWEGAAPAWEEEASAWQEEVPAWDGGAPESTGGTPEPDGVVPEPAGDVPEPAGEPVVTDTAELDLAEGPVAPVRGSLGSYLESLTVVEPTGTAEPVAEVPEEAAAEPTPPGDVQREAGGPVRPSWMSRRTAAGDGSHPRPRSRLSLFPPFSALVGPPSTPAPEVPGGPGTVAPEVPGGAVVPAEPVAAAPVPERGWAESAVDGTRTSAGDVGVADGLTAGIASGSDAVAQGLPAVGRADEELPVADPDQPAVVAGAMSVSPTVVSGAVPVLPAVVSGAVPVLPGAQGASRVPADDWTVDEVAATDAAGHWSRAPRFADTGRSTEPRQSIKSAAEDPNVPARRASDHPVPLEPRASRVRVGAPAVPTVPVAAVSGAGPLPAPVPTAPAVVPVPTVPVVPAVTPASAAPVPVAESPVSSPQPVPSPPVAPPVPTGPVAPFLAPVVSSTGLTPPVTASPALPVPTVPGTVPVPVASPVPTGPVAPFLTPVVSVIGPTPPVTASPAVPTAPLPGTVPALDVPLLPAPVLPATQPSLRPSPGTLPAPTVPRKKPTVPSVPDVPPLPTVPGMSEKIAEVSRLVQESVLRDSLPSFEERFPGDLVQRLRDQHRPPVLTGASLETHWYREMRRPIDEELTRQARVQLSIEKRLEEARRQRANARKDG